jgi:hypothetical protein
MTTIAYHHKDKQVAVDGRITSHGLTKCDTYDKTIKNEIGLWVVCGTAADIPYLCKLKHNDLVDPIPDCSAFLIKEGKCFDVYVNKDGYCEYFEMTFNDTKGSGGELALAAMDFGKSAKEAVNYAKTRDIYTGGRVRVFDVK